MCWEFTGEDPTAKLAAAIEAAPRSATTARQTEPKPHYHGHRGRVRERVLKPASSR